jgi:ATP sulfurylase
LSTAGPRERREGRLVWPQAWNVLHRTDSRLQKGYYESACGTLLPLIGLYKEDGWTKKTALKWMIIMRWG